MKSGGEVGREGEGKDVVEGEWEVGGEDGGEDGGEVGDTCQDPRVE